MKSLILTISVLLYIVDGYQYAYNPTLSQEDEQDANGWTPTPVSDHEDGQQQQQQQDEPVTTTTISNGDVDSFAESSLNGARLIAKSNSFDSKHDKDHRAFILANVETYQLPSGDLLVRSRIGGYIDWIIHRNKLIDPSKQQLIKNRLWYQHTDPSHKQQLTFNRRNKRQDETPMRPMGDQMGIDQGSMRPGEPNMNNNPVADRFRHLVNRVREFFADIRNAFDGNRRVDTNMQGIGSSPPSMVNQDFPTA